MQKDNQKPNRPVVDEKYMMSIMAGEAKEQATPQQESAQDPVDNPVQKPEKTKQRKSQEPDYEKTFFKRIDTNARDGKPVYIQPEFHERLTRIVQIIGGDKLTIYTYLNNVLEYHFQEFAEQITESFHKKYKPIL